MTELIHDLKVLRNLYGVVGVKQSFEDEGVILDDVITMRRITELCGLNLYVKIGGCEANTDIQNCEKLGIDSIIAPMIETPFAMEKYMEATQYSKMELYFVCETKTAGQNIREIIEASKNKLSGIVIGRSDFCKSYGLSKKEVNSNNINNKVTHVLREIKRHNIHTTMGGNISIDSLDNIEMLYKEKLLDNIETRNIVISLEDCSDVLETIKKALAFEIKWMSYKAQNYLEIGNSYLNRAVLLSERK